MSLVDFIGIYFIVKTIALLMHLVRAEVKVRRIKRGEKS